MSNLRLMHAARAFAVMAALAMAPIACDDPIIVEDDEPETTSIVLTISATGAATQTITWNTENGSVTPATITIPRNQTRAVTAVFLRADGTPDPIINATDFRLDFNVTSGTAVTIAKNGNLAATFTAGANTGSITLTLDVEHIEEGHAEYGPSNAITVTAT